MNTTTPLTRNLLLLGIPFGLLGLLILLMVSPFFDGNDTLSLAITVDLLLIVPLVYLLVIRKSEIPKTTVVPVLILGLVIGYSFLPKENHNYLDIFKIYVLPLIEMFVITFVVLKIRKVVKTYKKLKMATPDFFDTLKKVCVEMFPKRMASVVVLEVSIFYYSFVNWNKRTLANNEFSYHKKSTTQSLLIALIMLIGIETVWLHIVLTKWNPIAAWILTALSVYSAFQIFGFAKALTKRPISIVNDSLILRYSIMNEAEIPLEDIESISLSKSGLKKNKLTRMISPLGDLESYNTIIHLKKENTLVGLYGGEKKFTTIGLHIDESASFKEALEESLLRGNE